MHAFSTDHQPWLYSALREIFNPDIFRVTSHFATLVNTGDRVCLAILKCLAIEEKGARVEEVDVKNFLHAIAGVKLSG